jgi:gentisate 1,2-dioxygenase
MVELHAVAAAAEEEGDVDYYRRLAAAHVEPLWRLHLRLLTHSPTPSAVPWHWSGRELRQLCTEARELVSMESGGERRVLTMANPGLAGLPFATPTISAAYQTLGPRETAPAHRHTPSALRFILEGRGVTTTVDGDVIEMSPGDLILTPSWTYHDHTNTGDGTMTWFDGLDVPLVRALDAVFYQQHPDSRQPTLGAGLSEGRFSGPGLVPHGTDTSLPHSPLLVYRWAATDAVLDRVLNSREDGVASIEFTNPAAGGPALPTIGCHMLRLRPGSATRSVRRTGNSIMVVHRGTGVTELDDRQYEWEPGDVISIPSWKRVRHFGTSESDVFVMTDEPVLRALKLFRQTVE